MRYNHERRLAERGAVNAVPENCSAYRPYGQICGELRPAGNAPDSASVANSLPKPLWYPGSSVWVTIVLTETESIITRAVKVANSNMVKVNQTMCTAPAADDVKERIVSFMRGASTEITPTEENRLPELRSILPSGTTIYVAHTPNAGFGQVIHAALAVQRAGFIATPHIAVRRVPDAHTLRSALEELRAGGVGNILLIAGDAPRPVGEFSSTLDVLKSGILEGSGIMRVGIAGHPEGHNAVAAAVLWEALDAKQAFAAAVQMSMHIVTQFGFNRGSFVQWLRELAHRRIHLPVRVGIAGPAPPAKLAHFAIQCGIGASVRALTRNLGAVVRSSDLATRPDQHLLALLESALSSQVVAPHFFAFGGAPETARWMRNMMAGEFDIDAPAARFRMRH
jgi:methylenetetrahydrofolate reductase (NADPH)